MPQNGLTFTIWANIIQTNGSAYNGLFSFTDNTTQTNHVSLRIVSGSPTWNLNYQVDDNKSASTAGSGVNITSNNPITSTSWNHYAWVMSPPFTDGSCNHTFYLNSNQIASVVGTYPKSSIIRGYLAVGSQIGNPNGITGYIDTFRYYEKSLQQSDISNIYNIYDPANVADV
jgi:hypothetical protein